MIFFHITQGYRTPPQGTNNTYAHIDNYDIIYQVIYRLKLQDVLSNEHKTSDGSGGSYRVPRIILWPRTTPAKLVLGEIGNSS